MKSPACSHRGFTARLSAVAAITAGLVGGAIAAPASALPSTSASASSATAASHSSSNSGVPYVALGDSYSAGTGAGGTQLPPCLQSPNAYPNIAGTVPGINLTANLSCFGATTDDVRLQEVPLLPANTRLVTVTVGGNDIGSGQVAAACTADPEGLACRSAIATSVFVKLPQLPQRLTAMFNAIKAKAHNARIVVLGYPHLFEPDNMAALGYPAAQVSTARSLNYATDLLNATIAGTSTWNGARFVDVSRSFAGHGVPSAQQWINLNPFAPSDPGNFHPNADGQRFGYAASLTASLAGLISARH
ncbi:SGNH/GDSL hydrolase family protein [Paenarthrobacter sp. Z7-10]|uniref:SGNH/GDSL hydrolase family protein n=1 Tax=Paenarthrobacter sp. Z7-10 TaxID=2787635 RepID=UPI0022A8DA3F|nr:SGNH/GDSL hydrolase family protein [Paenarthrobacter sp. Z7-10]MCZ2401752.1 SGNH/GDSL hydrolase family protein [Paenarthrobacter sp. Z7-10]